MISIRKNILPIAVIALLFFCCFCASSQVIEAEKKEANATPLLEKIIQLNATLPHTVSASFRIESISKNSFKSSAKLLYNVDAKKARMSIVDSVFGSQLSVVVRDNDTLYIYQPIENSLLVFDYTKFPVYSFLPFDIDVELIDNLLIGKIPLLKDYYAAKAVESHNEQFILLENDVMHQTISLKDNVPAKILFIQKRSNARYEIYFIKPKIENNIFTCNAIRLVDVNGKTMFEVTMQQYTVDAAVPDTVAELKLPKSTKIINYR
ncbi:MAG: hypothetical protein N3F66_10350 [Spirochaetes bacterium]|nr:hypothetical protein [Spirochaetota bacterium]